MKVALLMPNGFKGALDRALNEISKYKSKLADEKPDLIVFPEDYLTSSNTEDLFNNGEKLAHKLYSEHGCIVAIGLGLGRPSKKVKKVENTHYLLVYADDKSFKYQKHAFTYESAIDSPGWVERWKDSFLLTITRDGIKVSFSLCYDMYLPFIAREYRERGTHLYVNPSYRNVKYNKWAAMLQGRALEGGFYVACVLHHDGAGKGRGGSKGYALVYDPYGSPITFREGLTPYQTGGRPGLYTFSVDPQVVEEAREKLRQGLASWRELKVRSDDYKFPKYGETRGLKVKFTKEGLLIDGVKIDPRERFRGIDGVEVVTLSFEELMKPGTSTKIGVLRAEQTARDLVYVCFIDEGLEDATLRLLPQRLLRLRSLENRAAFLIASRRSSSFIGSQPTSKVFQPQDVESSHGEGWVNKDFIKGPLSTLRSALKKDSRVNKVIKVIKQL